MCPTANIFHISFHSIPYQVTLDGLPEELFGGGHEGACEEDGGGDLVEALEGPVVDGDLVDLEEELGCGGDSSEHLGHVGTKSKCESGEDGQTQAARKALCL